MKRLLYAILFIGLSWLSTANADIKPLAADKAFQLTASAKDDQTIVINFNIAPEYYLYRDKLRFNVVKKDSAIIALPILPPGEEKYNPTIGKYVALQGNVQFALPVLSHLVAQLPIRVHYQGCSSEGFCYPPMNKIIQVDLSGNYGQWVKPITVDVPKTHDPQQEAPLPNNDRISQILSQGSIGWIIAAFFGFGVLISLTPCILPMIPILSSIIVGHSQQGNLSHLRSFMLSLSYVLGMAITYAIAGMIFGYLGSNIQTALQIPWVIIVFALIFVLLSLSMFGYYEIQLPTALQTKLHHSSDKQKRGSYIGVALMGAIASLVLSPCVTPPLVGALGFISRTGNSLLGGSALFALGIGMGVPLLVIGATSAKLLPKAGPWMNGIKNILGVMLIAVAISLMSRIIPAWLNMVLWMALVFGCAYALGAFKTANGIGQRLRKVLGVLLFIYGIIMLIGLYQGNTNPLQPIQQQASFTNRQDQFIRITTNEQLDKQLSLARKNKQPVLLDFYADWCIACKQMETFTFSNPNLQQALMNYRLIKADITNNDTNSQALLKRFDVIAPPTLIFFNSDGEQLNHKRIVGEISAQNLVKHIVN